MYTPMPATSRPLSLSVLPSKLRKHGCPILRSLTAKGGMYTPTPATSRRCRCLFFLPSLESTGAPSFAVSPRRVGCTHLRPPRPVVVVVCSSFQASKARVPHPSQSHREGWDVHTYARHVPAIVCSSF